MRKAISLFSGAGGMDIGIRQAGFQIAAEVEIDEHACATLRAAVAREHLDTKIFEKSIKDICPIEMMNDLGINECELDLLFGGPPCQPFSLAGKQRGLEDHRGSLLFEIIRFAKAIKPKVILLEQVKGLLSAKGPTGKVGDIFNMFIFKLEKIGYRPKWRVLLAADFGVPQMKERLFVVATRDENGYVFPNRSHAPESECNGIFSYIPYKSVGQVLSGLRKPTLKIKGSTIYDCLDSHVDVTPDRDRERIAHVPEGGHLASQLHLGLDLRVNLQSKDTTKYLRLHRNKTSNTLRCGEIFYHPTENRYLTPREYMRIHGYPDDYELRGPIRSRTGTVKNLDQHRQVANSVPPPLAKVLGESIMGYLNEQNL